MHTLVSIGSGEDSLAVTELLTRLDFKNLQGKLLRVLERVGVPLVAGHPSFSEDLVERFLKMQELEELEKLSSVQLRLSRQGIRFSSELTQGFSPGNMILEVADREKADLIVTGCVEKSAFEKIVAVGTGSVTRKLASHAKQNILVARNLQKSAGPVNALLAIDHSPFGNQCLDTLLKFAPRGIGTLTVMTAYPKSFVEQVMKFQENFQGDVVKWMEVELERQNQVVINKLAPLQCSFESKVVGLEASIAIDHTLSETGAELLIMGSQGHGFLERITTGSLSFDQFVSGKHSVLVLRANPVS